jgi:hypothetical protein
MYINPDRRFGWKFARFFLLYLIICLIVKWFIREENEVYVSFANFSNVVVMACFMGIIFAVFDRERAGGAAAQQVFSKTHLRQLFFGIVLFLLVTIPLIILLYFIFTFFRSEKINLLTEFAKLGFFAILAAVLFSTFIWFRSKLKLRGRKDRDLGGF